MLGSTPLLYISECALSFIAGTTTEVQNGCGLTLVAFISYGDKVNDIGIMIVITIDRKSTLYIVAFQVRWMNFEDEILLKGVDCNDS